MKNEAGKPALQLVADAMPSSAIETVLAGEFSVTRSSPADFRPGNVTGDISFYVIHGDVAALGGETLAALRREVTENNAVLVLCGTAPAWEDGTDEDFVRFAGVARVGTEPAADVDLRVFPHYLAHGLDEYETVESSVLRYRPQTRLTSNDNVFIKKVADGTPVAFERVYGRKGRVVFLALGGTAGGPDRITLTLLKNLGKLKITADGIESCFSSAPAVTIALDKGVFLERPGAIGRWNALYSQTGGAAVYSHSALFLPASPEFFRDGKIEIWRNGGEITRERLLRSLSSVEIRNTDFCNQDCCYCFNRKSMDLAYKRISLPDALHRGLERDLLGLRADRGCSFMIRYTGPGEPLRHERTLPSLVAFEQAGIPTALITNGSALTKEMATELGKNATFVRFSVDAAHADTYASIRRCSEDMFDRTLAAIETINRGGKALAGVTFLICRQNVTQIVECSALMKRLGVKVMWLRSLNDPDEFTEAELTRIREDVCRAEALNDDGFHVSALQFWIYRKVNTLHYRYDDTRCWSRFTKAVVQPNGDVIACLSHKDFVLGNIHDTPFSEIWGSKRHLDFIGSGSNRACSQCIESRFNNSLEFMYCHDGEEIVKAQRELRQ